MNTRETQQWYRVDLTIEFKQVVNFDDQFVWYLEGQSKRPIKQSRTTDFDHQWFDNWDEAKQCLRTRMERQRSDAEIVVDSTSKRIHLLDIAKSPETWDKDRDWMYI